MTPREISASLEDYLEAVYHIVDEKQAARAKDIAHRLDVKASSVTGALRQLSEKGLVNYAPYDIITLTPKGKKAARIIVQRHGILRDFLINVLGLEENEAEEQACKLEHETSEKTIQRLVDLMEFFDQYPQCRTKWNKHTEQLPQKQPN